MTKQTTTDGTPLPVASRSGYPKGYFITLPIEEDRDSVHVLSDAVRIVAGAWPAVAISTVLFTALAVAAAFVLTPVYRSETVLAPVEQESSGMPAGLSSLLGNTGLAAMAGIQLSSTDNAQALATLRSRVFTEDFIRDQNLMPVLFADLWDAERSTWTVKDERDVPTLWDAFELFDEKVRFITEDSTTGLITLAIQWKDRAEAARWANLLVERVNARIRAREIEEAQKSIDYLNQEITKTSLVDLQGVVYHLIEEQINRIMLANVREEYAFVRIDPAVVPDEDAFVSPNRPLVIAIGVVFGLFVGVTYAFARNALRRARPGVGSDRS